MPKSLAASSANKLKVLSLTAIQPALPVLGLGRLQMKVKAKDLDPERFFDTKKILPKGDWEGPKFDGYNKDAWYAGMMIL